ncbi:WhiB family transcriptional regulator [Arthrobacter sp. GCM10027362]|uniref:WhiB family transcriptional regulator n=1 Tax=Arthrobacter sp. GCM10027362 TaxID=3273379 RepID=UPI003638767C
MSQPQPRQLKDATPELPEWKAFLAARSGAVVPCDRGHEWFSDDVRIQARAAALCGACAVKTACGVYALAAPEKEGVWGGMTPLDRKRLRRAARAA